MDELVERLRRGYAAYNRGAVEDGSLFTDNFVLEQMSAVPGTEGTFPGVEGMLRAREELLEGWDEFRFDPEQFEWVGERLVVRVRVTSRTRGMEQSGLVTHVWDIDDGRFARCRAFASRREALAAIA